MRLEVSYIDHPKFVQLTDGAFRLWHEGKSYCEKHLTDGLIAAGAVNGFRYANPRRLEELQTAIPGYLAPLWEVHPVGFKMHDYLDHNDCREVALKRIDRSREEKDRRRQNQQTYRDDRRERASRDANVTGHESVTNAARVTQKSTPTTVPSSSPSDLSATEQQKGRGAPERSKRPIFSGQRFTVFEWQLESLERLLGAQFESFDCHAWFFALDAQTVASGQVVPQRDGGAWLLGQTEAEAKRRGLTMAATKPQMGKLTTRLATALDNIRREAES